MAELRRRRTKMSEITAVEQEQDESSVLIVESSADNSCDFSEETDSKGDLESEAKTEQREDEKDVEETLEYVANVDVTVKSGDSEGDSSSSEGSEGPKVQGTGEEISEGTSVDDVNVQEEEEEENDGEEIEDGEETVTCALLGLEHAKVSLNMMNFRFSVLVNQGAFNSEKIHVVVVFHIFIQIFSQESTMTNCQLT